MITLTNIVPNSNFEVTSDWAGAVYDTSAKYRGSRSSKLGAGTTINQTGQIETPIVGHKYYGRSYIKSQGDIQPADCRFEMHSGDGAGLNFVFAWNQGNFPDWTMQSSVISVDVVNGTYFSIRNFVVNAVNPCWTDCLMIIDLTESFGTGQEPSKEWLDENVPYFENTYELAYMPKMVYDRTQADVDRAVYLSRLWVNGTFTGTAEELAEWASDLKGAYNASDLNRVGSAVEYLTETLYSMGYNVPTVPKDDWTETDIQTQAQMDMYIENIHLLRDCLPYVAPDSPDSPTYLTYEQANNIEKILYTLESVLLAMQENFKLRQANTLFMIAGGVFNNA